MQEKDKYTQGDQSGKTYPNQGDPAKKGGEAGKQGGSSGSGSDWDKKDKKPGS